MRSPATSLRLVSAALLIAALSYLAGCESGGGGDSPAGTSTVQGNVASFSAGSAFYVPSVPVRGFARVLCDLGNLLVPSAAAAVPGVRVRIMDTDQDTTTADDGSFVMSGVPAGHHQVEFSMDGMSAIADIDVPEDATVFMDDIQVHGGAVHATMHTQMHGSSSAQGPMMNSTMM